MKNIALPLLLAGSASAQPTRKSAMAQDRAVPEPILIAAEWAGDGDCADAAGAVAAAASDVATAGTALDALNSDSVALIATVVTAAAAKDAAVAAVIAKNGTLAADLAADDTAQLAELTAKTELDNATIAATAATAAKAAADAAVTTTATAFSDATALKAAMDTAVTNATSHHSAEQAQTLLIQNTSVSPNTGTLPTAQALTSGLTGTQSSASTAQATAATNAATNLAATALALTTKNEANRWLVDYTTQQTAVALVKTNATAPKNTADTAVNTTCLLAATASCFGITFAAFNTSAQLAVTAVSNYLFVAEAYADVTGAGAACTSAVVAAAGGNASANACQGQCNGKLSWMESTTTGTGLAAATTGATGTTHCFGYQWATGACSISQVGVPTAESAGTTVGTECKKRSKIEDAKGAAMFTTWETALGGSANSATNTGAQLTAANTTGLDQWKTLYDTYYDALEAYTLADAVVTKFGLQWTSKNGASGTADSGYTTALGTSNGTDGLLTSANTALNAATTAVTANATVISGLTADLAAQQAEEAAQLAVKTLAEGDQTAQAAVVITVTSARDNALTDQTTAGATETTANATLATKTTEYSAAVTAASATAATLAPGLADLATLRATLDTTTTDLDTAVTAVTDKDAAITLAEAVVATEVASHLAAIVTCKETRFDEYAAALATAEATRAANLATIEALVDAEIAAAPARGKAGARCEKAMSNGTFRPARGEQTCDEGLCCGAAKVPVPGGEAVMTVETCQAEAATVYAYRPPRAPMATTAPATTDYPFTCIQGAQKLATAASALAAAVYMLA